MRQSRIGILNVRTPPGLFTREFLDGEMQKDPQTVRRHADGLNATSSVETDD